MLLAISLLAAWLALDRKPEAGAQTPGDGNEPFQVRLERTPSAPLAAAAGLPPKAVPQRADWPCDRVQALAPQQSPGELVRVVLGQTFIRLTESDRPLARAAGELLLASPSAQPVAALADQMSGDCERNPSTTRVSCVVGRGRPTEAMRLWAATQTRHEERLRAMARQSADPQLYAWARLSCGGDCDVYGLSAQGWADRDPHNAAPWLALADEALRRGDVGGLDSALWRATQAHHLDLGA